MPLVRLTLLVLKNSCNHDVNHHINDDDYDDDVDLGMPVVRFISLLANGQSDTQWLPRHLHHHEDRYFVVFL